ncbi:hypothetical protein [Thermaurantiacus sp.]
MTNPRLRKAPRQRRAVAADAPEKPRAKPRTAKSAAAATTSEPYANPLEALAGTAVARGGKQRKSKVGDETPREAGKAIGTAEKALAEVQDAGCKPLSTKAGRNAAETANRVPKTLLGRNVLIGAGAGAALGLRMRLVGPITGAIIGGGLGDLRTLTRRG